MRVWPGVWASYSHPWGYFDGAGLRGGLVYWLGHWNNASHPSPPWSVWTFIIIARFNHHRDWFIHYSLWTVTPPTLCATRDPQHYCSSRFPHPSGSSLVSRYPCAMDLQASRCASDLHSFGCSGILVPPGFAWVLANHYFIHLVCT